MAADLKKITIDGVGYEAEARVVETMHQLTTRLDSMEAAHADALEAAQTHIDAVEAERDQLRADNAKLKAELEAAPKAIQARIDARMALVASATAAGIEVKADQTDKDIMIATITKTDAAFKADGKSDDYLAARFDAAILSLKPDASKSAAALSSVKTDAAGKPVETNVNKIDAAEQKMRDKHAAAWKRPQSTQAK